MALRPRDFKSLAYTSFAIRAVRDIGCLTRAGEETGHESAITERASPPRQSTADQVATNTNPGRAAINLRRDCLRAAAAALETRQPMLQKENPAEAGLCARARQSRELEAEVGIEPAYADLQSAA